MSTAIEIPSPSSVASPNTNNATSARANGAIDSLISSTTLMAGVGGQPRDTYHNTGDGCCDDVGTFPSIHHLQQMQRENNGLVVVTLRDWYITNYCTDAVVQQMANIQKFGQNHLGFWTKYFLFWSFFGDYLFYITMLPAFGWVGFEEDIYVMATMLGLGMFVTDTLKDVFAAPRPPCPPLRRGGHHGHSLEYGLPSTHACNATILAVEFAIFFSKAYPAHVFWVWAFAAVFVFHICFSRVWLGMHWPADIYAGLMCFVFLWLLEFTFLRDMLIHLYSHPFTYPFLLPLLAGHLLLVFHAAPRGTCPCFEDSARFLGVVCGCLMGKWHRMRWTSLGFPVNSHEFFLQTLFSWNYLGRFITGVVAIVVVKGVTGAFLPKLLKHFFNIASGSLAPKFARIPPLLFLYKMFCYSVGILLGKQLRLEVSRLSLIPFGSKPSALFSFNNNHNNPIAIPVSGKSGAIMTGAAMANQLGGNITNKQHQHQQTAAASNNPNGKNVVSRGPHRSASAAVNGFCTPARGGTVVESGDGVYDTIVKTAEDVAFGTPTMIAPPGNFGNLNPDANVVFGAPNSNNAISSAMGQKAVMGPGHPDRDNPMALMSSSNFQLDSDAAEGTAAAAAEPPASSDTTYYGYGGRYWTLRNHIHWWEHEIQSKYLNYLCIGWAVMLASPWLIELVWGPLVIPKHA